MNKQHFLDEVEKRLAKLLSASKQGYPPSPLERHRLEGFMEAGVFLGLVSPQELNDLKENTCQAIFHMSVAERIKHKKRSWPVDEIDYSQYEKPLSSR